MTKPTLAEREHHGRTAARSVPADLHDIIATIRAAIMIQIMADALCCVKGEPVAPDDTVQKEMKCEPEILLLPRACSRQSWA